MKPHTIIGILITIIGVALFFYYLNRAVEFKEYCGTIKYKVAEQTKYGLNRIFVVQYQSFIRDQWVSRNDFLSLKEGDEVCYKLNVSEVEGTANKIGGAIILGVIIAIIGILLACYKIL